MSIEITAPTDKLSGIPYPIISELELPRAGNSLQDGELVADWHHPFHPRSVLIGGSAGDIALRNSRVQWVNRKEHNLYHKIFDGPELPSESTLLKTVIFAAAGHVPEIGLKVSGNNRATIDRIPSGYREHLWKSKQIRVANKAVVRDYLLEAAIDTQGFKGISETVIDEFLSTEDRRRRVELGNMFLGLALYDVTAILRPDYIASRQKELLPPSAPRTVGRCAMNLVTRANHSYAMRSVERRLRMAA